MTDLEGTRQIYEAICVSTTPDFCKSPSAPVAYNILSHFSTAIRTAPTVLMTKCEAFTTFSRLSSVEGNEPGIGGGVKSGVNLGFCRPFSGWSSTVRVEGNCACRHDIVMEMNCPGPDGPGNTYGKVTYVECYSCAVVDASGEIKVDRPEEPPPPSTDSNSQSSDQATSNGSAPPPDSKPPSFAEQQAQDIAGAKAEIAGQVQTVKDYLGEAAQSAQNIIERPGIVLDNLNRLKDQIGNYASTVLDDPSRLLSDAKAVGSNVVDGVGQIGKDVVDGVANNQPLTALAKVGPKLYGMATGGIGLAKTAVGATKMAVKGGKAVVDVAAKGVGNAAKQLADETGAVGKDISSLKKRNLQAQRPKPGPGSGGTKVARSSSRVTGSGGRYADLRKKAGPGKEVHHLPPDSTTAVPRKDGPAIIMDEADHRLLDSTRSKEFLADIDDAISSGNTQEAIDLSIAEIQEKFGTKYDDAIRDALDYLEKSRVLP